MGNPKVDSPQATLTGAWARLIGPGERGFRPLAVHDRPLPVTIGRSSSTPADQPVTVAYRPVGVRRAAVVRGVPVNG